MKMTESESGFQLADESEGQPKFEEVEEPIKPLAEARQTIIALMREKGGTHPDITEPWNQFRDSLAAESEAIQGPERDLWVLCQLAEVYIESGMREDAQQSIDEGFEIALYLGEYHGSEHGPRYQRTLEALQERLKQSSD
jgi:hypothetical protein